jgi:hypothetical protein
MVCVFCRAILVLRDDLRHRLLTNAEWLALPVDLRTRVTHIRDGLTPISSRLIARPRRSERT